jgi:hypothetical protein
VLLHHLNSLLTSVSLPTLHNILDATPYLLIVLYEALPPTITAASRFRGRKRIPFVERKTPNAEIGTKLRNLKLLVGSIVHDEDLDLSRKMRRRLAELDLQGFCRKETAAVRRLLETFVEVAESIGGGDAPRRNLDTPSELFYPKYGEEFIAPRVQTDGRLPASRKMSRSTNETLVDSEAASAVSLRPPPPKPRFGGRNNGADYHGSRSSSNRTSRQPPPTIATDWILEPAEEDEGDESSSDGIDESLLMPLPPSPPLHTRYLSLNASDYFKQRSPRRSPSPRIRDLAAAERGSSPRPSETSSDDRTSIISVSPASWGPDSPYTAALRQKRDEALERLRNAEEQFQRQIEARERFMAAANGLEAEDEEEDDGEDSGTIRTEGPVLMTYEDIADELPSVEEDGTVQVDKLEELVRAMLARKGYRVKAED